MRRVLQNGGKCLGLQKTGCRGRSKASALSYTSTQPTKAICLAVLWQVLRCWLLLTPCHGITMVSTSSLSSSLRGESVLECPHFIVLWIWIPREIPPPSLESQVSICLSLAYLETERNWDTFYFLNSFLKHILWLIWCPSVREGCILSLSNLWDGTQTDLSVGQPSPSHWLAFPYPLTSSHLLPGAFLPLLLFSGVCF